MSRCLALALKGNYIAIQEIVHAIETGNITPEDIDILEAKKANNIYCRYLKTMLVLFGKPGEQGDIPGAFKLLIDLADEEDSSWAKVILYRLVMRKYHSLIPAEREKVLLGSSTKDEQMRNTLISRCSRYLEEAVIDRFPLAVIIDSLRIDDHTQRYPSWIALPTAYLQSPSLQRENINTFMDNLEKNMEMFPRGFDNQTHKWLVLADFYQGIGNRYKMFNALHHALALEPEIVNPMILDKFSGMTVKKLIKLFECYIKKLQDARKQVQAIEISKVHFTQIFDRVAELETAAMTDTIERKNHQLLLAALAPGMKPNENIKLSQLVKSCNYQHQCYHKLLKDKRQEIDNHILDLKQYMGLDQGASRPLG